MDNYEQDIARQPSGPFNSRQERKTIRRVTEHWVDRQRYNNEFRRRFASYGTWIGLGTPIVVGAFKIFEFFFTKGN